MTIQEIEGVIHVDQPFPSEEITVWAKLPTPRTAQGYNEKAYSFSQKVAKCLPEGYTRAIIHYQPE